MQIERMFCGGYREDRSDGFTFILEWDADGKYRGQWQDDMLGDAGMVFIPAPLGPVSNWAPPADLTADQMHTAESPNV